MRKHVLVFLCGLCLSTTLGAQPSFEKGAALVVGQVSIQASNFSGDLAALNGEHLYNIQIEFTNQRTGELATAYSDSKGLFSVTPKVGDRYKLTRVTFKANGPDSAGFNQTFAGWSKVVDTFDAAAGVSNLGHFSLTENGATRRASLSWLRDYATVKSSFTDAYPSATSLAWNEVLPLTEASMPAPQQDTRVAVSPPAEQPEQQAAGALDTGTPLFNDIYPVFHTYYDTHPLGSVVLFNRSGLPVTDIKVSFQIKQFMTEPTACPAASRLEPGENETVDLFGLFLPTVLDVTEKTKAQARIDIDYVVNGQAQHQGIVQGIPILDRNATTWEDNRRAAAFVTTKDPAVLAFSKNVNSMVQGKVQASVNPNLLTALALFQSLQLYGLTYSQDPLPTKTENGNVADYIQFPRQTLQYRGGKCSDFSVLYCALLESMGIETAFITTPGHIFMAFSTGLPPGDARNAFSSIDDLIVRSDIPDRSWIPIEVTENAGFLQAWKDGAREWRESLSREQADFYPLHDAWQLFEPVALPGADVSVSLPAAEKIVGSCQSEVEQFVDHEISARVAVLGSQIAKAQDPRKPLNELGVLYARYGQYAKAQAQFEKLLAKEEYVPALLNMGNILYLTDQKEKALDFYNRAYAKDSSNPRVLLSVAKASHDLEDYFRTRRIYADLKALDPDLARQFAYLDLKGEESTRAADASGQGRRVVWEEQ